MTSVAASWTADPFATQFERRGDGSIILRPLGEISTYPRTPGGPPRALGARRAGSRAGGAARCAPARGAGDLLADVVAHSPGGRRSSDSGSVPRPAHRHPLRQQHRAFHAFAGRDVGRHSLLSRVACLLAGERRSRKIPIRHGPADAGTGRGVRLAALRARAGAGSGPHPESSATRTSAAGRFRHSNRSSRRTQARWTRPI